jgi:hypothetical protein
MLLRALMVVLLLLSLTAAAAAADCCCPCLEKQVVTHQLDNKRNLLELTEYTLADNAVAVCWVGSSIVVGRWQQQQQRHRQQQQPQMSQ